MQPQLIIALGWLARAAFGFSVPTPAFHMVPVGWTNDPDVVFVPGGNGAPDSWHNFYQATKDGSNNAPWSRGEIGVWRHASTLDWSKWEDHGIVNGTDGWGTGTILAAPPGSPGAYARSFPGGPGIGLGVTNDSTLNGGWSDWPTSAVPFPRPPANAFVGDPFLFFDTDRSSWGMVVATCLGGTNFSNCALPRVQLYAAPALLPAAWSFESDLFVGPAATGIRPECPRLWRFLAPAGGCPGGSTESVTLLIYSSTLQGRSLWFLGRTNASAVFTPAASGLVDAGSFYAAHVFGGSGGWGGPELSVVGWLEEQRPQTPVNETPWFNLMSAPRATTLAPDCARLSSQPSAWIRALRSSAPAWAGNVSIVGGAPLYELPAAVAATGAALWLDAELISWGGACSSHVSGPGGASARRPTSADGSWAVLVLASGVGVRATTAAPAEFTTIVVAPSSLSVNLSASSLYPGTGRVVYAATAAPTSSGFVGFTALIDQNAVEVFGHSDVAGEAVVSTFAYPSLPASTGVFLRADNDACVRITAYAMPTGTSSPTADSEESTT